jgi:hypothetical protein
VRIDLTVGSWMDPSGAWMRNGWWVRRSEASTRRLTCATILYLDPIMSMIAPGATWSGTSRLSEADEDDLLASSPSFGLRRTVSGRIVVAPRRNLNESTDHVVNS